ncbi:MAG: hypothetical protein ABJD07_05305 [Gemmatimonadaceae bacterium]
MRKLVVFWRAYNEHVARVMEATSETDRTRARPSHNLDQIAWRSVPAGEPATLEYLMRDYVGHLQHHVRRSWTGNRGTEPVGSALHTSRSAIRGQVPILGTWIRSHLPSAQSAEPASRRAAQRR